MVVTMNCWLRLPCFPTQSLQSLPVLCHPLSPGFPVMRLMRPLLELAPKSAPVLLVSACMPKQ